MCLGSEASQSPGYSESLGFLFPKWDKLQIMLCMRNHPSLGFAVGSRGQKLTARPAMECMETDRNTDLERSGGRGRQRG